MTSIRARLMLTLLILWAVIWGAITMVSIERANHEVEELLDAELAQTARVLRIIALAGNLPSLEPAPQPLSPIGHPYESKISFQVWDGDDLLSAFGAAPETRLADVLGFSDQLIGATRWRVFGLPYGDADQLLYVAQDYSIRNELVQYLTLHAMQPILWSVPLAALLIWLAVADGLRSLERLARDVGARSGNRLDPIREDGLPSEVQPLIRALNRLMEQLRETLGAEQRFTADASHELRTPLSVIRTYAQVAERSQDPAETRQAFAAIDSGINRTARLLTQLLALSRLCRDSSELGDERGSLILATVETVESCRPAARAKKIELETRLPMQDNASVDMSPEMLETMLSNLLDNALKFTPPGGRVVVEILLQSDATCLVITDSGPGIPSAERERVFDRFYRANGPDQAGAGLGLSIVKRICDLHGVDIRLDGASAGPLGDGGSGLRVEVRFPPHDSTANGQAEGAHD